MKWFINTIAAVVMGVATYSTVGVVQSVSTSSLVITHAGKQRGEMTFVLSPTTHREGMVDVGSTVSVRYVNDGAMHVATAVTAEHPRPSR